MGTAELRPSWTWERGPRVEITTAPWLPGPPDSQTAVQAGQDCPGWLQGQRGAPPKAPLTDRTSPTLSRRAARHGPSPDGELHDAEHEDRGELHDRSQCLMVRAVDGLPGRWCGGNVHFRAMSWRCQASSVVGVSAKTRCQRSHGTSREMAESQILSAGA